MKTKIRDFFRSIVTGFRQMKIGRHLIEWIMWMTVAFAMVYLLDMVFKPTGAYSQFPAGVLRMMLGVGALIYVIKTNLTMFSIRQIVEEKNVAAAIVCLSFALIIAAAIMTV